MATCICLTDNTKDWREFCDGDCAYTCGVISNEQSMQEEFLQQQQQQELQSIIDAEAFAEQELELLADCIS